MAEEQKEETPTQPTQPVQQSSGGSGKTVWIIVIVVLVVVIAIGGLGYYFVKKAVKKVADVGVSTGTFSSGSTEVSTGENQTWPSDLPSDVPQFSAGAIKGTSKIDNVTTIMISGVTEANFTDYKKSLTDKGWTLASETNVEGINTYEMTKSGYKLDVMYTAGDQSALISVTKES